MLEEADNQAREPVRRSPLWWTAVTLLFVTGLIFSTYAFDSHRSWPWLGTITAFAIVGMMLLRATTPEERDHFKHEWEQYLKRRFPHA
jgi:hypothetical protein